MDRDKIAQLQDAMNTDLANNNWQSAQTRALVIIANLLIEETKTGGAFSRPRWVGGPR